MTGPSSDGESAMDLKEQGMTALRVKRLDSQFNTAIVETSGQRFILTGGLILTGQEAGRRKNYDY